MDRPTLLHIIYMASGTYASAMEELPAKKRKRLLLKRPEKDTLNSTTPGDNAERAKKTLELKSPENRFARQTHNGEVWSPQRRGSTFLQMEYRSTGKGSFEFAV